MLIIVKRRGHIEKFDEKKVYGPVYAACASANYVETDCEKTSEEITNKIKKFLKNKKEIQSTQIRKKIVTELKNKDKELSFYYEKFVPNLKKL